MIMKLITINNVEYFIFQLNENNFIKNCHLNETKKF